MPPEGTSYGEQTWLRGAVDALLALIESERLERPIVAGHFLEGSQIGLRMAIDHPDRVRGVVLLAGTAGLVPAEGKTYTLEQRIRYQDENMAPRWFKTVTLRTWNDNNFSAASYSRDAERGRGLFEQVSHGPLPVLIRYLLEFWASDLMSELGAVRAPLLLLGPDFEPSLLADPATSWLGSYFADSWADAAGNPLIERRRVTGAHIFVWQDEPEQVRSALDAFAAAVTTRTP